MNLATLSPLVLLLSLGSAALAPRRAEACSPAEPRIRVEGPARDQVGVPTNTKIWVSGVPSATVELRTGGDVMGSDVVQLRPNSSIRMATPHLVLQPNTQYTVTATSTEEYPAVTWSFTTGAGPDTTAPTAPGQLNVSAERVKEEAGGCVGPRDGYQVNIDVAPVASALFYELEVEQRGAFVSSAVGSTPSMGDFLAKLPSPRYRVRAISLTGAVSAEGELPVGSVDEADNEDSSGGCSAAGTGSSSGSSALWLLAGALGFGLVARRRRVGARQLAQLGLG